MKKKILFLIHDLGEGGAEKVLVNLVNNMNQKEFDISIMALFGGGVNQQFIKKGINLIVCHKKMVPGNSRIMKLFTPKQLFKYYIKNHYDIIVSYLEGPSARIVSGCQNKNTKLVCWIHIEQHTIKKAAKSFRNVKEAIKCYNRFDKIICVSKTVKEDFLKILPIKSSVEVLYNTNETEKIKKLSKEKITECQIKNNEFKIIGVGKLLANKGFDRILRISNSLIKEGFPIHVYILGIGPKQKELEDFVNNNNLVNNVSFLGYQLNPYKFVSKSDLFVCASYAEGFSTAATESLIVGTPVCTVEVSGMKEMLGDNNEFGIITKNNDEALYEGIKKFITDKKMQIYYNKQAIERGKAFSTENTVNMVEEMLLKL